MKIRIIAVGRLKEKFYSEAVDEFKKRLSKFCEVEIIEIADEKAPEKLSAAELCGIKDAEGRRILEKLQSAIRSSPRSFAAKCFPQWNSRKSSKASCWTEDRG